MKTPIPNLGEYKPKKGKKLVHVGTSRLMRRLHPKIKFTNINERIFHHPIHWCEHTELFLTKQEYNHLNVRDNGIPWSIPDVPKEITDKYDFEAKGWGWDNGGVKCRFTTYKKSEGWDNCGLEREYIVSGYKNHFFIKLTPKPDPKERDLSGVQHILDLLVPEVRKTNHRKQPII